MKKHLGYFKKKLIDSPLFGFGIEIIVFNNDGTIKYSAFEDEYRCDGYCHCLEDMGYQSFGFAYDIPQ